jgi:Ca2+-transporting ATPase
VFARTSPGQKLDLLKVHQEKGKIVAMIGDGVNDAPALKKADIGVAMGKRGTQVAKEASDMILTDDKFSSIVLAVQQGRNIFANIRKFIVYLLSCNIAEVLIVALASILNFDLFITPLQILYLNLITDVFPALALGVGRGDASVMHKPPRSADESIITGIHWVQVGIYGILITIITLAAFGLTRGILNYSIERSVTISYLTLAFSQLFHVLNMRSRNTNLFKNEVTTNLWIWLAIGFSGAILIIPIYIEFLADLLTLQHPGLIGYGIIFGIGIIPVIIIQFFHWNIFDEIYSKIVKLLQKPLLKIKTS